MNHKSGTQNAKWLKASFIPSHISGLYLCSLVVAVKGKAPHGAGVLPMKQWVVKRSNKDTGMHINKVLRKSMGIWKRTYSKQTTLFSIFRSVTYDTGYRITEKVIYAVTGFKCRVSMGEEQEENDKCVHFKGAWWIFDYLTFFWVHELHLNAPWRLFMYKVMQSAASCICEMKRWVWRGGGRGRGKENGRVNRPT